MPINEHLLPLNSAAQDLCLPQDPATRRQYAYDIGEQLNRLYDDIQAGVFGAEAKSGAFAQYVSEIKSQFPKS